MTIQVVILLAAFAAGLVLASPGIAAAAALGAFAALWGSVGMMLGLAMAWRALGPGAALLFGEGCKILAFIPPLALGIMLQPKGAAFCLVTFAGSVLVYRAVFGFQALAELRQQPTN
jgi:hypothetical protein